MRIKSLIILLLVVITSLSVKAQNGSELLIKANHLTLERKYDEALTYYEKFINLYPEDFRGYFNKGTTLYNAKRYAQAIQTFSKTLELNPVFKEAIYYRGQCYAAQNQHALAIKDYSSVLANDEFSVPFLKLRAESYSATKQYNQAVTDLTKALSVDKLSGDLYKRRAETKALMNDYTGAVKDYNAVEKLLPAYKMVHYIKGNLYLKLDDKEYACIEFQKALDAGVVVADRNFNEYCVVVPKEEN